MFKKKRARKNHVAEKISMTPMIDIVFQLLIFFVFTYDPIALFSNLEVIRPMVDKNANEAPRMDGQVQIVILSRDAAAPALYSLNDRPPVGLSDVDQMLQMLASLDLDQSIRVLAAPSSLHVDLVDVLNHCTRHGLRKVSVLPVHSSTRRDILHRNR